MTSLLRRLLTASLTALAAGWLISHQTSCAWSSSNQDPYVKVQFVSPSVGWIVGSRLLQTADGGRTWRVIKEGGAGTVKSQTVVTDLHSFQFINPDVGVAWLGNTFSRTTDGGRNWQDKFTVPPDNEYQWLSFFFLTPEAGWAVGKRVHFTDNGGRSWQLLGDTPGGDYWRQRRIGIDPELANYRPVVRFVNKKHGLMGRLDGVILATSDGGKTWGPVLQVDKKIQDVFLINELDGWAVGDKGFAARTDDGGLTWVPVQTPTDEDLYTVFFSNKRTGCVAGSRCTILCTKDGGITWDKASIKGGSTPSPLLVSISFSDELHGWAVGGLGSESSGPLGSESSGIVLASSDGGRNWEAVEPLP